PGDNSQAPPRGGRLYTFARRGEMLMRILGLLILSCTVSLAQNEVAQNEAAEKLAPYYPTPETIVDKMLQLGGLKAGEKVYDLGSGDGRIVIMAAQKYHADSVGFELDKDLCKLSIEKIRNLHLERDAPIVNGDL